jgi:hypothetical protein
MTRHFDWWDAWVNWVPTDWTLKLLALIVLLSPVWVAAIGCLIPAARSPSSESPSDD